MSHRNARFTWLLPALVVACAGEPAKEPTDKTAAAKSAPPQCLRETGTRLPPKDGSCSASPGRSVSREELDRSGEIETSDKLGNILP